MLVFPQFLSPNFTDLVQLRSVGRHTRESVWRRYINSFAPAIYVICAHSPVGDNPPRPR